MRFLTLGLLLAATLHLPAQTYVIDSTHSALIWGIQHLGLGYSYGRFNDFSGTVQFDPDQLAEAAVSLTVQVASIDSHSTKRDDHLRNADFFDAGTYPTMTFQATGFRAIPDRPDHFTVSGTLTIRGVTQPLTITVHRTGAGIHAFTKKPAIGFHSTFELNRSDFGVGQGDVSKAVGETVRVIVSMEALVQ